MKIYILENGWTILGQPVDETSTRIILEDVYCVRRWGTNAGIGQLAQDGIRKETILDPQPRTAIHKVNTTFEIDCNDEIWSPEYVKATLVDKKI